MPKITRLKNSIKNKRHVLVVGSKVAYGSIDDINIKIVRHMLRMLYGTKSLNDLKALFFKQYKKSATFENVFEFFSSQSSDLKKDFQNFLSTIPSPEIYNHISKFLSSNLFYRILFTTDFTTNLENSIRNTDPNLPVKTLTSFSVNEIDESSIFIIKICPNFLRQFSLECIDNSKQLRDFIADLSNKEGIIIWGCDERDDSIFELLEKLDRQKSYWIFDSDELSRIKDAVNAIPDENRLTSSDFSLILQQISNDLTKVIIRRENEAFLSSSWLELDKARSFGNMRKTILETINKRVDDLLHTELDEVLALKEFVEYEFNRSGESYRLQQGIQFLETALESYIDLMADTEIAHIEFALLSELLNLFLSGDQIPGTRNDYVNRLIDKGKTLLNRLDNNDSDLLLKIKCLIALGEAFKEKALISSDSEIFHETNKNARDCLEKAISLLENINSIAEFDHSYQLGLSYRHLAVTYELEGDATEDSNERRKLYQAWQGFSSRAINVLESISEDTVRGYAMMNQASSFTRLADLESVPHKRLSYLDESKKLIKDSIILLLKVDDYRGIGWAYIHLCDNLYQRFDIHQDKDKRRKIISDLEKYANRAVANLKLVDDHLAQGLAYTRLGNSLYKTFCLDNSANVKLKKAIPALELGAKLLEQTSYYRGVGETLFYLSECYYELWKNDKNDNNLSKAISTITNGILSTTSGLQSKERSIQLYNYLKKTIKEVL